MVPVPPLATGNVPDKTVTGIVAVAVMADVPVPFTYPVNVAAPVPPLATGTMPRLMAGVVVPVATLMGDVPVTEVTVPVVGVVHLNEHAVAPAVRTLPLLVVLVAITCRFPSPVGWV